MPQPQTVYKIERNVKQGLNESVQPLRTASGADVLVGLRIGTRLQTDTGARIDVARLLRTPILDQVQSGWRLTAQGGGQDYQVTSVMVIGRYLEFELEAVRAGRR